MLMVCNNDMGLNKARFRGVLFALTLACLTWIAFFNQAEFSGNETMGDRTLDHFMNRGTLLRRDGADVRWYHAANSKHRITQALQGDAQMIEADVLLRSRDPPEPIMAHPPDTDSDVTLQEWLKAVEGSDRGIKLDFKSLAAVAPSMALLDEARPQLKGPVWINADILPGPGGVATPLDARAFLQAVALKGEDDVLSLGWTTGWSPDHGNPGYSWEMVRQMEAVCRNLTQAVTFPVRAALVAQSFSQLRWLLEQSERYTLTIWTGQADSLNVEDLLAYRQTFNRSRIYYDLLESQMLNFKALPGYK